MSEDALVIYETEVLPGQSKTILIPLPSMYDCSPMSMPVHVIRGKKTGPTLCVTAAIHGDEINGVETVRRLLSKRVLRGIRGTLICVPVVNVYGFVLRDRYMPDRRDLNRSFPGSATGSLAARLAHLLFRHVISSTDFHIDLHSGSFDRSNLPQVRISEETGNEADLAKAFNAPVIVVAKEREGSLRQMLRDKGITALVYEAGEAHRFNEVAIRAGIRGIVRAMHHLNMLESRKAVDYPKVSRSSITHSSIWVRSRHSGIFTTLRQLGKKVEKGEVVAQIGNPFTGEEHNLISPHTGIVIGINKLPLVHEGAALLHIASFEKLAQEERGIQEFAAEYPSSGYLDL